MARSSYYGNSFSEYLHNLNPGFDERKESEFDRGVAFEDMEFMEDGLCRQVDPALFFPDPETEIKSSKEAKKICKRCPVQKECLEYAVTSKLIGPHGYELGYVTGVWGGTYDGERRKIRVARGITEGYSKGRPATYPSANITSNVHTE